MVKYIKEGGEIKTCFSNYQYSLKLYTYMLCFPDFFKIS